MKEFLIALLLGILAMLIASAVAGCMNPPCHDAAAVERLEKAHQQPK
jgi:hypothetical protein